MNTNAVSLLVNTEEQAKRHTVKKTVVTLRHRLIANFGTNRVNNGNSSFSHSSASF